MLQQIKRKTQNFSKFAAKLRVMREIRMVELYDQYQRIKTEVDAAIEEVIRSSQFIRGEHLKKFQNNLASYLGVKHAIGCGNGTDALQIALMALDLKPGDEVLTPSFTFIATCEVIALLGLKPVFVDVHPEHFVIDIDDLKSKITDKSKAIIPVHLFGQCADMEAIMEIADENELFVIEDNAQAIGADYTYKDGSSKKAGTIGHIGTTSFFPSKNLGCYGDGGAIFTDHDAIAERMTMITNHGSKVKYYNEIVGVNSRLDTIQAAVLDVKLKHLDEYAEKRQAVADYYDKAFEGVEGIELPKRVENSTHVFHQYTMKIEEGRDEMKEYLAEQNIPTMIYFPVPMHEQEAYKHYVEEGVNLPVSEQLPHQVLSLPICTEKDEEQLAYIAEQVVKFLTNKKEKSLVK